MLHRGGLRKGLLLAALLVAADPLLADEVAGAPSLLCAARQVFACAPGVDCSALDPGSLNIPDFVVVDLVEKQLRTTGASGENRTSAIQQVTRAEGLLFLQGVDTGRAWSFLIVEETGALTASVAREALSVSVFGVCTPAPMGKP
jgi:hypothetical protein